MQVYVRVVGVNPQHLRKGAGHSLDGNAIVLLLVDNLDAVGDVRGRVNEVGSVVQQDRAVANEVARGAEGLTELVIGPRKHLLLGGEHRQTLGAPRVNHLVHGNKRVAGSLRRWSLTLGEHTDKAQRPVDEFTSRRLRRRQR